MATGFPRSGGRRWAVEATGTGVAPRGPIGAASVDGLWGSNSDAVTGGRNAGVTKPVGRGAMPNKTRPTPMRSKDYARIPPVMRYAGWKVVVENDLAYGELVVNPATAQPLTGATQDVILISNQTWDTLTRDPVTLTEVLKDIVNGSIASTGGHRFLNDLPEFRRLMREQGQEHEAGSKDPVTQLERDLERLVQTAAGLNRAATESEIRQFSEILGDAQARLATLRERVAALEALASLATTAVVEAV